MDTTQEDLKSIHAKIQRDIDEMMLQKDEDYYLLSLSWFRKFDEYIGGKCLELPGKIDNSSIKRDVEGRIFGQQYVDFYFLSKDTWNVLYNIFKCKENDLLCRKCVTYRKNPIVEVNPLKLLVKLDITENNDAKFKNFVTSRYSLVENFRLSVMDLFDIDNKCKDDYKVIITFPNAVSKTLSPELKRKQLIDLGSFGNDTVVTIVKSIQRNKLSLTKNDQDKVLLSSHQNRVSLNHHTHFSSSFENYGRYLTKFNGSQKSVLKGVSGLRNLGNSCYMNAALQCLSNTILLRNYFLGAQYQQDLTPQNTLASKDCCIAKAMAKFYDEIWIKGKAVVVPKYLKDALANGEHFVGNRQEDSHELLAYILDKLNEDLTRIYPKPSLNQINENILDDLERSTFEFEKSRQRENSIVQDVFEFQQQQKFECPKCGYISKMYSMLRFLTIPIPPKSTRRDIYFVSSNRAKPMERHGVLLNDEMSFGEIFNTLKEKIGFQNGLMVTKRHNSSIPIIVNKKDMFDRKDHLLIFEVEENVDVSQISFFVNFVKDRRFRYQVSTKPVGKPIMILKATNKTNLEILNESGMFKKAIPSNMVNFDKFSDNNRVIKVIWQSSDFDEIGEYFDVLEKDQSIFEAVNGNIQENFSPSISLHECLLFNSQRIQLDENNLWLCPKCSKLVPAFISTYIFRLPKVLIIHLKRFTKLISKNTLLVDFPIKELDMEPFVADIATKLNNNFKYDLFGVIQHGGTLSDGHYIGIAKNSIDNQWYEFNDSLVSSTNDIVTEAAYVLFYQLKDSF
eukprot:TRINITY_DN11597_c0_g1_i1.p1 TRINITY_DN11597_c0_g1~~TRINITY_DN11597_c0_g1_i1.p1  ORF type:complete len:790 (+),score=182.05 TRINITY_DN11597_c0_g1_i1:38-2407(+)